MACSRCGTARAPASIAPATRSSTATPTARRRTAACWSSRATTTAACRRRCRTRATWRCRRGTCRCCTPANVAEYLEFGLYGWALSRFSGNWVGFKAISEVVESGIDGRSRRDQCARRRLAGRAPVDCDRLRPPAGGLHYRWPDLPSLDDRGSGCTPSSTRCAPSRASTRSTATSSSSAARHRRHRHRAARRTSTCMEVLRRLDISPDALAAAGVRIYKVGLAVPLEPTRIDDVRARACDEILVIEEKGRSSSSSCADLFYNRRRCGRAIDRQARRRRRSRCVSALGELRPSRLIEIVADWLARPLPAARPAPPRARLHRARAALERGRRGQARAVLLRRLPAQHLDQSARRLARAGRHRLPLHGELDGPRHRGPDPDGRRRRRLGRRTRCSPRCRTCSRTSATAPTTTRAISRSARRSRPRPTITYKILFNDAVAMTGGQPVDGIISVDGDRAPGRGRGREAGRRAVRRHRASTTRSTTQFPGRHRVPRPRRARRRAARACARCRA